VAGTSRRSRPQCDSRSISIVIYKSIWLFRPVARSTPHWWIVRILLLLMYTTVRNLHRTIMRKLQIYDRNVPHLTGGTI
jgi:hypothetical protein